MGITRYTTRTRHGSAMLGPSQPDYLSSYLLVDSIYLHLLYDKPPWRAWMPAEFDEQVRRRREVALLAGRTHLYTSLP